MIRSRVTSDGRVMIFPFFKPPFEFQIGPWRAQCNRCLRQQSALCGVNGGRATINREVHVSMQQLPSDVIGLSKVMPPLSRRGFMSSSAAAAAGYTLAAGPVRADAIVTDTKGLDAGMAKVAVAGGDMPVYFARPAGVQKPLIILVCMEIFGLHEW